MKGKRLWPLALFVSALFAPIENSAKDNHKLHAVDEGKLPSLARAPTWLNSPPLTAADLRGKVVLVDFWTYTCINWRRTLPYLRVWAEKYRDQGLVIVGVHTPEFGFEREVENVRRAARSQHVDYPIAIDSDYAIWESFGNQYWPALYFIDAHGRIRHQQFGEGDYYKLEAVIRKLLAEAGHSSASSQLADVQGVGVEALADWQHLKSPETYLGFGRSTSFVSPGGSASGRSHLYAAPARLKLNEWALTGDWTMRQESTVLNQATGRLTCRFHARDVHLVMAPAAHDTEIRFRVLVDGRPPADAHGVDIDAAGNGKLDEPRMYQLIRQQEKIEDRQFEIEFLDAGAELYVLTFG